MTKLFQVDGIGVYVHWSLFAVMAIMLAGTWRKPAMTLVGLPCYMMVLLIHEYGHMVSARRLGCQVYSIDLYPFLGLCRFEPPWNRFDHSVIAWGGVLAQAAIAFPILAWIRIFGFTRFEVLNAALAILSLFSLTLALFNLIPQPPLDGAMAWAIIPEGIRRIRARRNRRPPRYISPR